MKLAYLAPEIPALSATFVYNEILALTELGHEIIPFSVHKPIMPATVQDLDELRSKVIYLYATSKKKVLFSHLKLLAKKPFHYIKALGECVKDMFQVNIMSRDARGLLYRFIYAAKLAQDLVENDIQHLHVHFAHVPTDIAMYASMLSGITFSVTAHANDIFERGLLLDKKVKRSVFFATISDFNRHYIQQTYQVEPEKLEIIRCGVDSRVFTCKSSTALSSPVRIGVVGRLVEKKGIDTLISALVIMRTQFSDFIVEIAGSGPLEEELKQQVKQLELTEKVIFLGPLPHDQVVKFVTELDLFVLPCKKDKQGDMDGIPVVLMEAMMVGTAVISSKISGIPELVVDEETGKLIEPGNSEQLAAAMFELINDEALREQLISNAEKKVQQEFAQDINAKRLQTLFTETIGRF
ncbi:glycosyltransferase family 4 protein [Methylophaga sulfidovorans]|uniref:Glycosyltransferase involved in cell wall bisynthesis n=1 Tax=Methylophaga sulfidovorans TaxID=45496 RepID=A0A1I3XNB4_9GAMM|nr:glycosyltransferase family 4 protein [Methylophaga sulfidovorans]SFK20995.1 Glycosyltransferase involved in cell wall bisynthesis [Methylophaga sulfidovorans]